MAVKLGHNLLQVMRLLGVALYRLTTYKMVVYHG
jgi:hypothetical protein